jgi:hypothetical protein
MTEEAPLVVKDGIWRPVVLSEDVGTVPAVCFVIANRTVSTEPDMVRIRDRDSSGKLLADIGYSPAKALRAGALLIKAALRLDPSLRAQVEELHPPKGGSGA